MDVAATGKDGRPHSPAGRARAWLTDACFPFWAERARHPRGGFRERVALDGSPLDDDICRVRVQARQTYVFARAALMGWKPDLARALVAHGVESVLGPCRREDGLFGRLVRPGIGLADPQPELYDNAFCVLALAWAGRALEDRALIAEADRVLAILDRTHGHPAGGYRETLPPRLPRRQNPHMHLFEVSLALHEASGDPRHAARAEALLALFEQRFLDRRSGRVFELLTDDLVPVAGEAGDQFEPGHGLEWVALIRARSRARGEADPPYVGRLYAAALPTLDRNGFAPMVVRASGEKIDASRRTWGQTEALRAHMARAEAGDAAAAADRARRLFDALFKAHLDPAPAGGWIDHYGADGRPCVDAITAATGYHLVTAFAETIASPAMQTGAAGAVS